MGSKFSQILSRSGAEVRADRANRFNKAGYRAMKKAIMDMEAKRDAIEEAISASLDLSTSNDRNSINAIEAFDAESWCNRMVSNRIALRRANEELQEANEVFDEYFSDVVPEMEGLDSEED